MPNTCTRLGNRAHSRHRTFSSIRVAAILLRLGVVLLLFNARPAFSQDVPSEESEWLETFLAAYNTGDMEVMGRFASANQQAPGFMISLYREFGPLTRRLRFEGAEWCQGDISKGWVGLVLQRILNANSVSIRGVRRGINPPGSSKFVAKVEDLPTYLEQYLQESSENGHFSGAVLVAKDGQPLFEGAFGFADRHKRIEVTKDTKFWLASLSKPFISVAVAKLAQEGKLRFDDPLGKLVPEYPQVIGDRVTIHHLLTHTSGIEMDHDQGFMDAVAESKTMDDLLVAHTRHVQSVKGYDGKTFHTLKRFDYTNEGPDLLGLIVQRVAGQKWEQYLNQAIFTPCNMSSTGTARITDHVKGLAKCYSLKNEDLTGPAIKERTEVSASSRVGTAVAGPARPAGSSYSTANDMFQFAKALTDFKIIDDAHWRLLTMPHVDDLPIGTAKRSYGYLFQILEQNNVRTVGHSGGAFGMSTVMEIYPDDGFIVIVLSNFDRSAARNVSEHIKELILLGRK